mgnify:CR=1 FL=1
MQMEQLICPVCHSPLDDEPTIECSACQTPHHQECWDYIEGCAIFGCSERTDKGAQIDRANALSVPAEEYLFYNVSKVPNGLIVFFLFALTGLNTLVSPIFQHLIIFAILVFAMRKKRALIGVHTRFDLSNRELVEESRFGSLRFWSSRRPLSSVSTMSIDVGMEDTGVVRCVTAVLKLTYEDGSTERLLFPEKDIETNRESDRRLAWARKVAQETGINFISPCAHNIDVAAKTLAVLPERLNYYEENFLPSPFQTIWNNRYAISVSSYALYFLLSPATFIIFTLIVIGCLLFVKVFKGVHASLQQERPWRGISINSLASGKNSEGKLNEGHLETIAALNEQVNFVFSKGKNSITRAIFYTAPVLLPILVCIVLGFSNNSVVNGFAHASIFFSAFILLQLELALSTWLTKTRRITVGASKLVDEAKALPNNSEAELAITRAPEEEPK